MRTSGVGIPLAAGTASLCPGRPYARPISDGGGRAWAFQGVGALLLSCAAGLRAYRAKFRIQTDN